LRIRTIKVLPTKALNEEEAILISSGFSGRLDADVGNAKLIDSTDVVGYGSIAVARRATGAVIGVSLGRPSPVDAENRAKAKCLKAGGTNPKVRWGFKG
jgi:hypothetical protein